MTQCRHQYIAVSLRWAEVDDAVAKGYEKRINRVAGWVFVSGKRVTPAAQLQKNKSWRGNYTQQRRRLRLPRPNETVCVCVVSVRGLSGGDVAWLDCLWRFPSSSLIWSPSIYAPFPRWLSLYIEAPFLFGRSSIFFLSFFFLLFCIYLFSLFWLPSIWASLVVCVLSLGMHLSGAAEATQSTKAGETLKKDADRL